MAKVAITESYLEDIADAIREKTGLSNLYYPSEMAPAIMTISGSGGITPTGTISITTNGIYNVTQYASANVEVSTGSTINNQDKTVNPSTSQQSITFDSGYTGLGTVTVNAMPAGTAGTPSASKGTVSNHTISITPSVTNTTGYITGSTKTGTAVTVSASELVSGTLSVTTNGTKDVTNYASVNVNVSGDAPVLQSKTYNVSSAGTATVTADSGYDGLSEVEVDVPSADVSVSVEGGFYTDNNVRKWRYRAIADTDGVNGWYEGSVGNWATYGAVPSGTSVTPTESSQTIGGTLYMMEGAVTINAIPSTYVGSGIARRSSLTGFEEDGSYFVEGLPGYYNSYVDHEVPNGTAGTPTATKGAVSNHSVSITPSVTNTTGYITGSTINGTAVTVTASELVSGTETKTSNGTYDVTNLAELVVNVSSDAPIIQSLSVTPSESAQTFNASGVDGYKPVSVSAISSTYVGSEIIRRTSSDLTGANTSNPTAYTITAPAGYYASDGVFSLGRYDLAGPSISVNTTTGLITATASIASNGGGYYAGGQSAPSTKQLTTQSGSTITPTESEQTAVAANIYTLGAIKVGAISSTYIGSGITQRSSSDLTVSGATVTVPAGYYSSQATKSVSTMTLPTSATSSATSGYTSKATIGRSTAAQYINIPPGYNSSGAYYVISAVANGSATGPTSLSGTAASVSTGTNTLTLTKTGVTTTPTVSAGYVSSATASTATVTLTASVTTKAAATITPTTTNQTIAAGTYLTGTQTIAGDADLVGGNILSTANIFGVQGTVVVQNYYTGSSAPSSSLGSNGDLYLQS